MQRRSFLSFMGAFGLAPAMNFTSLIPSVSAVAAPTPIYNHHMFGHALAMLRSRGSLSIAEFQQAMHFTTHQAEAIIGEFAREGHIASGFSATGILNAIKPTWVNWGSAGLNSPMTTMKETIEKTALNRDPIGISKPIAHRDPTNQIEEFADPLVAREDIPDSPLDFDEKQAIEPSK